MIDIILPLHDPIEVFDSQIILDTLHFVAIVVFIIHTKWYVKRTRSDAY
jgi:hypothetical protein